MYEQNASYLVKHSDLGANNLNKICLRIVQKVLKWPLQYVNFQKFSGEAYAPYIFADVFFTKIAMTPLEPFLLSIFFKRILPVNILQNKKKKRLKIRQILVLPP